MSSPKRVKYSKKVSIIIPSHNQGESLKKLLLKLESIKKNNWEIIVIDDASSDKTKKVSDSFSTKYHRFNKNRGPASARNKGAELAQGEILVFFDADVIPQKKGFYKAINRISSSRKINVLSGIWTKDQERHTFFADFKALRDWCYYFREAQPKGLYFFNTRVGMIKKKIFKRVKGFSTTFKKADLESFEISFRLQQISPIDFYPEFIVKHQFEGPFTLIKNYFKRTYYFIDLYLTYKRFGKVVATRKEAFTAILSALFVLNIIAVIFDSRMLVLLIFTAFSYLYQNKTLIKYFFHEKGLLFTSFSVIYNLILHLTIVAATATYILKNPIKVISFLKV